MKKTRARKQSESDLIKETTNELEVTEARLKHDADPVLCNEDADDGCEIRVDQGADEASGGLLHIFRLVEAPSLWQKKKKKRKRTQGNKLETRKRERKKKRTS